LATDDSQNSPQPQTTTRAIHFRNAAGAISMDKMLSCWQSIVNSICARKSTRRRSDSDLWSLHWQSTAGLAAEGQAWRN
jgi:hypothetical protein